MKDIFKLSLAPLLKKQLYLEVTWGCSVCPLSVYIDFTVEERCSFCGQQNPYTDIMDASYADLYKIYCNNCGTNSLLGIG